MKLNKMTRREKGSNFGQGLGHLGRKIFASEIFHSIKSIHDTSSHPVTLKAIAFTKFNFKDFVKFEIRAAAGFSSQISVRSNFGHDLGVRGQHFGLRAQRAKTLFHLLLAARRRPGGVRRTI